MSSIAALPIGGLLNEREAARFFGCSIALLQKWRLLRTGPKFVKVGKLVRYAPSDMQSFINQNTVEPETGSTTA